MRGARESTDRALSREFSVEARNAGGERGPFIRQKATSRGMGQKKGKPADRDCDPAGLPFFYNFLSPVSLDSLSTLDAVADAYGVFQRQDEDFAVANLPFA